MLAAGLRLCAYVPTRGEDELRLSVMVRLWRLSRHAHPQVRAAAVAVMASLPVDLVNGQTFVDDDGERPSATGDDAGDEAGQAAPPAEQSMAERAAEVHQVFAAVPASLKRLLADGSGAVGRAAQRLVRAFVTDETSTRRGMGMSASGAVSASGYRRYPGFVCSVRGNIRRGVFFFFLYYNVFTLRHPHPPPLLSPNL